MSEADQLQRLMDELARLGHVKTARLAGDLPNEQLDRERSDFLARHGCAARDAGYVAFLKLYGGAALWRDRDMLSLDLYGFDSSVSTHLVSGPGQPVEFGFLTFGDLLVPLSAGFGSSVVTKAFGFGFDATGEQRAGVYRIVEGQGEWFCDDFLQWLARLIEKQGRLHG